MNLAPMQRLADREAKRLGIETPLRLQWSGPSTCRVRRNFEAHAHAHRRDPLFGTICIRRGFGNRDLVKHEVAHFAPGGRGHGLGFVRARAAQGNKSAKRRLVAMGKARCPKHDWERLDVKDRTVTSRGIVITYAAACRRCGKEI